MTARRVPFALALAVMVAGCADPARSPEVTTTAGPSVVPFVPPPEVAPDGPPEPREENGSAEVYGTAAVNCANDSAIVVELHWEYIAVERQANDTSLAILVEWQPVNPTATELRLRLRDRDEPAGTVHRDQWGPSPQELLLFARDLAELNATTYLQVGVDSCAPEAQLGFKHVDQQQPQRFDWALSWNTASDQ